jgi:dienelactone hydrolase
MTTAFENTKKILSEVKPSMAYDGGNLRLWQNTARQKLSELLGMDKFTKVAPELEIEYETEIDWAREIRFTYRSEEGYRVPCHLFLPKNVEKPPVIITLQGHSKGMHVSMARVKYEGESGKDDGDRDFCVRAVKEGYAAIAMEQRNFGECGGDKDGPHCQESSMAALLMGRTTLGERVWDIMRLIDVLESDFSDKINIEKICCMGNSGGGTATAYVAALEDRIKLAMPSCAMCTYRDSIGAMWHCTCNYVPHIAEYFDMGDLLAMSYPKYYVQVNGNADPIFPIAGAKEVFEKGKEAYKKMNAEDRCVHVIGNGEHRFYADDSWPHVHKFMG